MRSVLMCIVLLLAATIADQSTYAEEYTLFAKLRFSHPLPSGTQFEVETQLVMETLSYRNGKLGIYLPLQDNERKEKWNLHAGFCIAPGGTYHIVKPSCDDLLLAQIDGENWSLSPGSESVISIEYRDGWAGISGQFYVENEHQEQRLLSLILRAPLTRQRSPFDY